MKKNAISVLETLLQTMEESPVIAHVLSGTKILYDCVEVVADATGRDPGEIMRGLRENPPQAFGNIRVTAGRDYLTGVRTQEGKTSKIDLPASDVLYFELEGGSWLCVRPSGTEPKIKLYVSARAETLALSDAMAEALCACAAEKLN